MLAVVVAAGQLGGRERLATLLAGRPPDLVVCADGGLAHARTLGLVPDLVIGDLDSVPAGLLAEYNRQGGAVQRLSRDKDETDTHLALRTALNRGAAEIILMAAAGSRLDHTLANLLLMTELPPAVKATMVTAGNVIRVLGPRGELSWPGIPGDTLSLVPLTPAVTGVRTTGLRWPLTDATLCWGESRGVSNEWQENLATVRIETGWLAVMAAWDEGEEQEPTSR